jgi:hypothetical protein
LGDPGVADSKDGSEIKRLGAVFELTAAHPLPGAGASICGEEPIIGPEGGGAIAPPGRHEEMGVLGSIERIPGSVRDSD